MMPGRILETKRGARIGDSLDDVVSKYSEIDVIYLGDDAELSGETLTFTDFGQKYSPLDMDTTEYTLAVTELFIDGNIPSDKIKEKIALEGSQAIEYTTYERLSIFFNFYGKTLVDIWLHCAS